MSKPHPMPLPEIVCGRFRLEARLVQGTNAEVWAATSTDGARVVVKVRSLASSDSWSGHERFEEAARILASFEHPGLPRVHAFEPTGPSGQAFVVLERLEGATLHERVAGAKLEEPELRALLRGLLETLAVLHARSIVHGDVTPWNVMFRDEAYARPVLVDGASLSPSGDPREDVRAAAEAVRFAIAHGTRISHDFRQILAEADDARAALRWLEGAPLPRRRPRWTAFAAAGLAMTLMGAVQWRDPARSPAAREPVGPDACLLTSDPPGATVYVGSRDVAWNEDHPLHESLGRTPLAITREARPLVLHKAGYRPFVLEVTAGGPGDLPCAFRAKLTQE